MKINLGSSCDFLFIPLALSGLVRVQIAQEDLPNPESSSSDNGKV